MAIYCLADLHLSFGCSKSMEIFKGWENYVQKIEENWRRVVTDEDTVVIAGDISWAIKLRDAYQDFKFLNALPGKKILIRGNHDYWWATASKIKQFFEENNFNTLSILFNSAVVCEDKWICGTRGWINNSEEEKDEKIFARENQRFKFSVDKVQPDGREVIAFLHYPPVYYLNESEEIINLMIERNIKKCYYGHIHGGEATKKVVNGNYKGISLNLVSCDYVGFCPVMVV